VITRKQHLLVLLIALSHFIICGVLGVVVALISIGFAMSDAYQPPGLLLMALDHILLLLEAPVIVVLRMIYHPAARFEPPNYYVIDFLNGSNFRMVLTLCRLWSVCFGYFVLYANLWFKQKRRAE